MGVLGKIVREIKDIILFFLIWFPGAIGVKLRSFIYKKFFLKCGSKLEISLGCSIKGFKNIKIGNNVSFGPMTQVYAEGTDKLIEIGNNVSANVNVMLNADNGGSIKIGDNVLIGPNAVLRASNHVFSKRETIRSQGHKAGSIVIEEDVWLGANVVVVADVVIAKGAVVGAGAVVTKNVGEYRIVAGVPAKEIGVRG